VNIVVTATKKKSGKDVDVALGGADQIAGGETDTVALKISRDGRKLLSSGHNRKASAQITSNEVVGATTQKGRVLVK